MNILYEYSRILILIMFEKHDQHIVFYTAQGIRKIPSQQRGSNLAIRNQTVRLNVVSVEVISNTKLSEDVAWVVRLRFNL